MNIKKLVSGTFATLAATFTIVGVAWAALTLGTNGGPGGVLTLFGSTSGSVTVQPAAVAGTGTVFQLPPNNGTSGYALHTNGAGVTSWGAESGGGAVTLIQTLGDSTPVSSLDFTSIGTYNSYHAVCPNLLSSSGSLTGLLMRFRDTGTGTFVSATNSYKWYRDYDLDDAGATGLRQSSGSTTLTNGLPIASLISSEPTDVYIEFGKLTATTGHKKAAFRGIGHDGTNMVFTPGGGMYVGSTNAVDGIQFIPSTGTITGPCSLYGRNS